MGDLKKFQLETLKYTLITAALFEAGSIPLLKFSLEYMCGLAAGTCVSVLSFSILLYISKRVVATGQKWLASIGYLVRLPMYGIVFYLCMRFGGLICGVASLLGFFTGVAALIYSNGLKPKFSKRQKGEG